MHANPHLVSLIMLNELFKGDLKYKYKKKKVIHAMHIFMV